MPDTPAEGAGMVGAIVRGIQRRLLTESTRAAIETAVCEELVAAEPYVAAWIGEQDPGTLAVDVRAAAGLDPDTIERITPEARAGPVADEGPAAAVVTQTSQVSRQGTTNDGRWLPAEAGIDVSHGARAAIPLATEEESYGVLTVYSQRPNRFHEAERELLAELGESIAAAIASAEAREDLASRKRKYERLTERISDAYYAVDDAWRVTYWNEEMAARTGVTAEAARGEVLWDVVPALRDTTLETVYREAMATQEHHAVEHHFEEPEEVWVAVDVYPDADGLSIFSRDITARKEYERRLREQRDDLEVLNQVVRHDIRNDLQLISAYAELLSERLEGQDLADVETIARRARSAVELTQSARSLAAVMLQDEPETEPMPLASTLETQVAETRSTYPEAEITLEGEVPEVTVLGNELLSSVFRNLLKNAVQHNDKPEPSVEITVETDAESVTVSVADNGPGVPDRRKEDIFGKGEKGLESGGTGVGLYLVRTLVESYGGSVGVSDNDPVGAVFSVTLPRAE